MNESDDATVDLPPDAALAGLVDAAAQAALPDALVASVTAADHPEAGPQAGELWRAGPPDGGSLTMVWIRSVTPADVLVAPVSFDVELADESTLVVPTVDSPLGVALALHVGVEATIERERLVDRLGVIDTAATGSQSASGSTVPLDERIEYHALLADELAPLAPDDGGDATADPAAWWPIDRDSDQARLLITLHDALAPAHSAARITPAPSPTAGSGIVRAVAQIAELDAFVLVALLDEPVHGPSLLEAARDLMDADQLLNAVCLVEPTAPFVSVVIDRREVVAAIETPTGDLRPPRQTRSPIPVGDAVTKLLDTTITPFGRLAGTVVDVEAIDAHDLAVDVSAEAVRAVEASARGYKVEGKRPGYERVARHRTAIIKLVEDALNGVDVDVASRLDEDP
jgi:hypothetical protein